MGIKSHIWRSHGSGVGFLSRPKGCRPWNKGLTKSSDERVRKGSETQRSRLESGEIVPWQTGKSKFTDERLAKASIKITATINRKLVNGEWHNSFARSRRQIYGAETFDGTWEVHLAKWFDKNKIMWVRNKKSFPYVYDKVRSYTPDFYLPNIDCYVEVKGWKTPKDEAKWEQFPESLVILSGSDLQSLGIPIAVYKDWKVHSQVA